MSFPLLPASKSFSNIKSKDSRQFIRLSQDSIEAAILTRLGLHS